MSAKRRMLRRTSRKNEKRIPRQLVAFMVFLAVTAVGFEAVNMSLMHRAVTPAPLNAQGLRVSGAGRADATRVLPAALFTDARVKRAYEIAHQIPATLNSLYCWCGCVERGMRSNLECFESEHAAGCDICLAGAEVAWSMKQRGITDPAAIQRVLDARFGRQT